MKYKIEVYMKEVTCCRDCRMLEGGVCIPFARHIKWGKLNTKPQWCPLVPLADENKAE